MDLHNFFKTFETFVPKNVEGRDQKRIDIMVNMQNKMLAFLNINPEFGKQVEAFRKMLLVYQENCEELNNELKSSLKNLDLSKLKDLEEITKYFPKYEDEDDTVLSIFSQINLDNSDIRKMRALQKTSDQLNIYSDEKDLYNAIKTKIYSKQNFVIKTKNYEVILDYYKLEDWYATPTEKKDIDKLDLYFNTDGNCYYAAKFLGLTDADPATFLNMLETESPSFSTNIRKAFEKVITNMKRGKVLDSKYLDKKELNAEGLRKLDPNRNYGSTDILFFKKPQQ